mgnify:CR=1 FL=1
MNEFIAYPLEALNETYLNTSHAHVDWLKFVSMMFFFVLVAYFI